MSRCSALCHEVVRNDRQARSNGSRIGGRNNKKESAHDGENAATGESEHGQRQQEGKSCDEPERIWVREAEISPWGKSEPDPTGAETLAKEGWQQTGNDGYENPTPEARKNSAQVGARCGVCC